MKPTFLALAMFVFICNQAPAQTMGERVKDRAESDANYKVDEKVDQVVDKGDEAISNLFKKKNKQKNKTQNENNNSQPAVATNNTNEQDNPGQSNNSTIDKSVNANAPKVTSSKGSFSDFQPGNSVVFSDDFTQDAIGDFPAKWNSTGSGEVSQIDGVAGRWLELADNTLVTPEMKNALPENNTIEFDLFLNAPDASVVPFIQFGFSDSKNILTQDVYRSQRFWVSLDNYNDMQTHVLNYGLNDLDPIGNKQSFPLTDYAGKVLHVSIAINKARLRVYLDQTKIIDLPKVLTPDMLHTFYIASYPKIPASNAGLFIGNVKIATSTTDARSLLVKKMMEEGKASTSDILFDVNSDVIKPESYPIINQFGDALKSNTSLKIKIVGYTDSDGSDASNLDLSKKRASSVKAYLINHYSIDGNRIQTDGKGESQPVSSNDTEAGKAKNRRVEFIRL